MREGKPSVYSKRTNLFLVFGFLASCFYNASSGFVPVVLIVRSIFCDDTTHKICACSVESTSGPDVCW
jgi:hypothetical protein